MESAVAHTRRKVEERNHKKEILKAKSQKKEIVKTKPTFSCNECSRTFVLKSAFEKHKLNYNSPHMYFQCCKKIEKNCVPEDHKCRKKGLKKTNNTEADNDLLFDPLKQELPKDSNNDNNINGEADLEFPVSSSEAESEVEDVFKKQKRPYQKKKKSDQNSFDCQKCDKKFDSASELNFHSVVEHQKKRKFKCIKCEVLFESEYVYNQHVQLHSPYDKVICKGCKKVFDTLKLYYIHAKQYPGKHCFSCKLCCRRFPSEVVLEQHKCVCINGKPLVCGCGLQFTKYIDVVKHAKGTRPFNCCTCEHTSGSLTAHLRHMRKHSKQKPFECKHCPAKFAKIDFLKLHLKNTHPDINTVVDPPVEVDEIKEEVIEDQVNSDSLDPDTDLILKVPPVFTCKLCNSKLASEASLKKHEEGHAERIQCPDCGKFLRKNRLEAHRNTHKTSASLCPECGKLFDTRFKVSQHLIAIHYSAPVKCEICDKTLKTKKIYNEHMKTHMTSDMGFRIPQAICPICGLGLAQKGSLARHILLMHEKHKIVKVDVPHECKECGEICPNKSKYYMHRRAHRAMVDRFPCELCGRVFNKKQNLRRHIYLIHDERRVIEEPIYGCQVCSRTFREKKNLRRHYKMVHKIDDMV